MNHFKFPQLITVYVFVQINFIVFRSFRISSNLVWILLMAHLPLVKWKNNMYQRQVHFVASFLKQRASKYRSKGDYSIYGENETLATCVHNIYNILCNWHENYNLYHTECDKCTYTLKLDQAVFSFILINTSVLDHRQLEKLHLDTDSYKNATLQARNIMTHYFLNNDFNPLGFQALTSRTL